MEKEGPNLSPVQPSPSAQPAGTVAQHSNRMGPLPPAHTRPSLTQRAAQQALAQRPAPHTAQASFPTHALGPRHFPSLPGRAHASGSSLSPHRAHATEAPRSPLGISPRLSRGTHAQKPGAPFKHPRPHPLEPKTPSRSRHHNPTSTPRLAAETGPLRRRGAAAP